MRVVAETRPTGGFLADPRVLAGGAAGFACAALAVWAFRGLPLSSLVFWLAPLPVFLAGLSLGSFSACLALVVAGGALLPAAGLRGATVFLAASGVPALLLVASALRGEGRLTLSLPFALLGLWPALIAGLSLLLAPEGIGDVMTTQVTAALAESGVAVNPASVGTLVRAGVALAAAALAIPLLLCAAGAQRFLFRRGLSLRPTPAWREARLPGWYPALPLAAAAAAFFSPGLLAVAVAAALTTPLFLQGLAVLHSRLRGPFLALFYVVLVIFFIPLAALPVALGLFEHFGRKPPST